WSVTGVQTCALPIYVEGILLFAQELVDRRIEAFGMQAIDFRRVHAQRAVHEDGDSWQLPRQRQLMQGIDDLLGPANGERGNDDLALALQGFAHHSAN